MFNGTVSERCSAVREKHSIPYETSNFIDFPRRLCYNLYRQGVELSKKTYNIFKQEWCADELGHYGDGDDRREIRGNNKCYALGGRKNRLNYDTLEVLCQVYNENRYFQINKYSLFLCNYVQTGSYIIILST